MSVQLILCPHLYCLSIVVWACLCFCFPSNLACSALCMNSVHCHSFYNVSSSKFPNAHFSTHNAINEIKVIVAFETPRAATNIFSGPRFKRLDSANPWAHCISKMKWPKQHFNSDRPMYLCILVVIVVQVVVRRTVLMDDVRSLNDDSCRLYMMEDILQNILKKKKVKKAKRRKSRKTYGLAYYTVGAYIYTV